MLRDLLITSIPICLSIATHISYREEPVSTDNLLTERRNNTQHLYSGICGFKLIVIASLVIKSLDTNTIKSYWLIKLNTLVCYDIRNRGRAILGIRTSESNGTIACCCHILGFIHLTSIFRELHLLLQIIYLINGLSPIGILRHRSHYYFCTTLLTKHDNRISSGGKHPELQVTFHTLTIITNTSRVSWIGEEMNHLIILIKRQNDTSTLLQFIM